MFRYICFFGPKVPHRITFMLASAFLDEHEEAAGSKQLKSHHLLSNMRRLGNTGKETDPALLETCGLQARCKLSFVDIGLKEKHPILSIKDFLQMLAGEDRLDLLSGGGDIHQACATFWEKYHGSNSTHPVYRWHQGRLHHTIPMALYADEGQSHKRSAFMILAYQPIIGRGTSYSTLRPRSEADLGVNMVGQSVLTRFIFSCMKSSLYSHTPEVFNNLLEVFTLECKAAFEEGITIQHRGRDQTFFLAFLFAKGDWPMLVKMGKLERLFSATKKGICHMCMAGPKFPDWHEVDGSWLAPESTEASPPWNAESHVTSALIPENLPISERTWFYRPDLFHTLHKGLMAELAGSAVDSKHNGTILARFPILFFCNLKKQSVSKLKLELLRWCSWTLAMTVEWAVCLLGFMRFMWK